MPGFRQCLQLMAVSTAVLMASTFLTAGAFADPAPQGPSSTDSVRHGSPPNVPVLDWADCSGGFQCASAKVPLDYDRPSGTAISVALIRLPATDSNRRIGSLFLNPGGPGGSGVDFVRVVGALIPAELRSVYDIVGFDPRGIGQSTPLQCFDTLEEALAVLPPFPVPITADEIQLQEKADRGLSDACAANGGVIVDHMSTANVARDLDHIRRAAGDKELNYLGYSYGTYLGQTYANLFPNKVGAFVLDGVLDPIAWSTGRGHTAATTPFSTRLHSDDGAEKTLQQFFQQCDQAGPNCAFSGGAQARYDALEARLMAAPAELPGPEGAFVVTYAVLNSITLGAMYSADSWPFFAQFLSALDVASSAVAVQDSLAAVRASLHLAAELPYPQIEGFPGVACSDSDNPLDYDAWPNNANKASQYSHFGQIWTWVSSICQPWPGQDNDRYTGPWNKATSTPILVVGNNFDPATRYEGAQTAARLLPNSRLLTYAGWGHTAFISAGNDCINTAVLKYLTTKELPRRGTVCQPAGSPFDPKPAPAATPEISIPLPDTIERGMAVMSQF